MDGSSNVLFEVLKTGEMTLDGGTFSAKTSNQNTVSGLFVAHRFELTNPSSGTGTFTDSISLDEDILVVDVIVVKTGGSATGTGVTITLTDGTNNITNVMSLAVVDRVIVRPTLLDDSYTLVSATLQVDRYRGDSAYNIGCNVYVVGVKVP